MDGCSSAYTNQISYSSVYISPFETSTQPKLQEAVIISVDTYIAEK